MTYLRHQKNYYDAMMQWWHIDSLVICYDGTHHKRHSRCPLSYIAGTFAPILRMVHRPFLNVSRTEIIWNWYLYPLKHTLLKYRYNMQSRKLENNRICHRAIKIQQYNRIIHLPALFAVASGLESLFWYSSLLAKFCLQIGHVPWSSSQGRIHDSW